MTRIDATVTAIDGKPVTGKSLTIIVKDDAPKPQPTFLLNAGTYKDFPSPLNFPEPPEPHTVSVADMGGRENVLRMEIKDGDPQWGVDKRAKTIKRRAEFSWSKWRFGYGQDAWASGLVYLPSDPMATIKGLSFMQMHSYPDEGVLVQIACYDGKVYAAGKNEGRRYHIGSALPLEPYLDRWVRVTINCRGEVGDEGFVKVWLDDRLLGETRNVKLSGKNGPFFKNGLYYWGWGKKCPQKHAVAYFDNVAIGRSREEVEI